MPLNRFQKKTFFIVDVATGRRWLAKLLGTRQVTQINLPRQESVNSWYDSAGTATPAPLPPPPTTTSPFPPNPPLSTLTPVPQDYLSDDQTGETAEV